MIGSDNVNGVFSNKILANGAAGVSNIFFKLSKHLFNFLCVDSEDCISNLKGKLPNVMWPLDKGYKITPAFSAQGQKKTYFHPTNISYTAGMCVSNVKEFSKLIYEMFSRPWISKGGFDTFTAKRRSAGPQEYYGGGCYIGGGMKNAGAGTWANDKVYCHSGLYPGDWLTFALYSKKYDHLHKG